MALVSQQRVLAGLEAVLPPDEVQAVFQAALAELRLPAKALYRPDEVALIGQAVMQSARATVEGALAEAREVGAIPAGKE